MYEKLVEATRRSMALLDDVVYVLASVLSEAISRDTRFGTQPTVTAELTKRAKTNAIGLVLARQARPPRGLACVHAPNT